MGRRESQQKIFCVRLGNGSLDEKTLFLRCRPRITRYLEYVAALIEVVHDIQLIESKKKEVDGRRGRDKGEQEGIPGTKREVGHGCGSQKVTVLGE